MRWASPVTVSVTILLGACGGSGGAPASTSTAPTPMPTPPSTPVVASVSACEDLGVAGSYTLVSDLPPTTTCLRVTTSHVAVECAQHALGAIAMGDGVSDVSFQHCRSTGFAKSTNVSNVTIQDNTLSNIIYMVNPTNVSIERNQISTTGRPGGVVIIDGGNGNQILNNQIDGGYHGHDLTGQGADDPRGADDGIILTNTGNATIQGNTIANVFDAGIEGDDEVQHTTIAGNTITNAVFVGISSYWCTVWDGNVIRDNTVSQSLELLRVTGSSSSHCAAPSPTAFSMNGTIIAGNRLVQPLALDHGPLAGLGIFIQLAGSGNVLLGNDVGSYGITAAPAEAFADGGGNVCGAQGNFHC